MKKVSVIFATVYTLSFLACAGNEIFVSILADSGIGSLREALQIAKKGDKIIFEAALADNIVELDRPLPEIKRNIHLIGPSHGVKVQSGNFEPLVVKSKKSRIENLSFVSEKPLFLAEDATLIWNIEKGEQPAPLAVSGEGVLIKNGEGILNLAKQNEKFKGAIHVREGCLEGDFEGGFEVKIEKEGELKGGGTAKKIVNEGFLRLKRRKLKINEEYIQNGRGTLQVELSPSGDCGFIQVGERGLFEGILNVICAEGDYRAGQTYRIAKAKGEIFCRMELKSKKGNKLILRILKNDIFIEVASPFSVLREL